MKKIKVGLLGASGKMGLALQQVLESKPMKNFFESYVAVSSQKPSVAFRYHFQNISSLEKHIFHQVDVWIDFTSPHLLKEFINQKGLSSFRLVSGTTGLNPKEFQNLKLKSKKNAIFWASNMSPGLWAFRQALKSLQIVSDFDFAIEETHHTHKKDNPSGTALTLQKDLQDILHKELPTPVGHRVGDIFGQHKVKASSNSEVLTFEHHALNRTVFAEGALRAAQFLVKQKSGLYSMEDLYKTNLKRKNRKTKEQRNKK